MAKEMVAMIQKHGRIEVDESEIEQVVPMFEKGDEVVVLVNNLGGTSNFEMSILARSCVKLLESEEYGVKATRVFVGSFMTSFNMHGASLTILNVQGQQDIVDMLDLPTDAPAWHNCDVWASGETRASATEVSEVVVDDETIALRKPYLVVKNFRETATAMATACAENLSEAEPLLTKYDTIVGDGDCGITMKRGAIEVLERLQSGKIPVDHPVSMFVAIADAVSKSMGGTSGVLIELLLRKMASSLSRADKIGVDELCNAFNAGVDAVRFYGGAQVGSRTMLDALVPGAITLVETKDLAAAAAKCREGADGTANMKSASAGRSNYLAEDALYGTPDPGAVAVAIVMESLCQS
jgi:dihydroxyacetone kinase